jgi:hypothetical protein
VFFIACHVAGLHEISNLFFNFLWDGTEARSEIIPKHHPKSKRPSLIEWPLHLSLRNHFFFAALIFAHLALAAALIAALAAALIVNFLAGFEAALTTGFATTAAFGAALALAALITAHLAFCAALIRAIPAALIFFLAGLTALYAFTQQPLRHLSGQDGLFFCKPDGEKAAYGQDVKIRNACKEMDVPMIRMDVPMFSPLPMLTAEKIKLHFNP